MNFLLKLAGYIYFKLWSRGLWLPRDRRVLINEVFPLVAKKSLSVLFVGVQKYTADYEKYFKNLQIESIDVDPKQAVWGFKKHHIGILDDKFLINKQRYDAVIMNGVIGYGLDDHNECEQTIKIVYEILNKEGLFILGVNPHQMGNVELKKIGILSEKFLPVPGIRNSHKVVIQNEFFKNLTHEFYFYKKITHE